MAGQRITLGDMHVDLEKPFEWGLQTGSQPFQSTFYCHAEEAARFLARDRLGKETTLIIHDMGAGGASRAFAGVYILGEAPSPFPFMRGVMLSDRRWKWKRALISGGYNIRRRSGRSHLAEEGVLVPLEIAGKVDELELAPWSLKDGAKWKPEEMLRDVVGKLQRTDDFDVSYPKEFKNALEVNDLDILAPGDVALEQAVGFVSGTSFYVSQDAEVVFFDALDQGEIDAIKAAGVQFLGRGALPARKFDFSGTRPGKVRVFFLPEYEVRIDSAQEGGEVVGDSRTMVNVVPITDPKLSVGGKSYGNGTIIPFDEAFTAWNADTVEPLPAGAPPISHTVMQDSFFADQLLNLYAELGIGEHQPIWTGRCAAAKASYRTLFRVEKVWMDRVQQVKAVRAGMLDPVTGRRAPALCWSDWCVWPSEKAISKNPDEQFFLRNVTGYDAVLANGKVAPAVVEVLDEQVGLIKLDFKTDPYGWGLRIYPSKIANLPTHNMADQNSITCLGEVTEDGRFPKLAAGDRKAVVVTMIPAAPNGLGRLYSWEVSPDDVKDRVGPIGECNGPDWNVFVRAGVVTARFAWRDEDAGAIERAFGLGVSPDPQQADLEALADHDTLKGLLTNANEIEEMSKAIAASMYARMIDRPLGQAEVRFNPTLVPRGALGRIVHRMGVDGEAATMMVIDEERQEIDPFSFLSDAVRKSILREVQ